MEIDIFKPTCNLDTVRDGRGGIFTWVPEEPIVEWNLNIIKEGKVRGHHYHPEFVEYFLVVEGEGVHVYRNSDGKEKFFLVTKGQCLKIPKNVPHVFYAIKDTTAVTFLTKKWDESNPPIVYENMEKNKNIVLIGYKGFVGSAISKKIKAVGVDRDNYEQMKKNEYDIVINCAMPSKRFWALNNPLDDFGATVGLTADIFYNWKFKKLIQISSVSARVQLDHPYGVNKAVAESIVLSNKNNLVVRLGALFGEGLDKGVISDMLNGNEIFVSGNSRYNYISTENVAEIISDKLDKSGIIDIGAKDSISLKEIADYFKLNVKFGERLEEQITENPDKDYPEAKEILKFIEKKYEKRLLK